MTGDPTDAAIAAALRKQAQQSRDESGKLLKMARDFDQGEGEKSAYQKMKEYENSIINPNMGRKPEKRLKTQIELGANGDLYVNTMKGDQIISSEKIESKPKQGAK